MKSAAPLLILLLVLTACTGDDPVVGADDVTTTDLTTPAGATGATDGVMLDDERLDGLDEEVLLALQACEARDAEGCDTAAAMLSDDEVALLVDLCTSDQESYCTVLETLFADADPVSEGPTGYAEALDNLDPDAPSPDGTVVMDANGAVVDGALFSFGEDPETVISAITDAIGPPREDTGYRSTDGSGCGGQEYRLVTWAEMTIAVLDLSLYSTGIPHFASWHTDGPTIAAQAYVGDSTLVPLSVGTTTLGELRDVIPAAALTVTDEEPLGATFTIEDEVGPLVGQLSTTEDSGVVQAVAAGDGCGE